MTFIVDLSVPAGRLYTVDLSLHGKSEPSAARGELLRSVLSKGTGVLSIMCASVREAKSKATTIATAKLNAIFGTAQRLKTRTNSKIEEKNSLIRARRIRGIECLTGLDVSKLTLAALIY